MENTPPEQPESIQPEKLREQFSNRLYAMAAAMLFIISIVLGWLFLKEKSESEKALVKVTEEKAEVQSELRDLLAEYQEMKTQNEEMNSRLDLEKEKITGMLRQIEKLKGDSDLMKKYKKEANALRKLVKVYLRQVDSLNTSIRIIKEEKEEVEVKLKKEKQKSTLLVTEKEKLNEIVVMGSQLKTYRFSAIGVRYSGGGEKEKPVTKARRVERIKVCFTIGENSIARIGQKTVFLRFSDEHGNVFPYKGDSTNVFEFEGKQLAFSSKKEIEYQGIPLDLCLFFDKTTDLKAGKYAIDLFCEGIAIGETFVELE